MYKIYDVARDVSWYMVYQLNQLFLIDTYSVTVSSHLFFKIVLNIIMIDVTAPPPLLDKYPTSNLPFQVCVHVFTGCGNILYHVQLSHTSIHIPMLFVQDDQPSFVILSVSISGQISETYHYM